MTCRQVFAPAPQLAANLRLESSRGSQADPVCELLVCSGKRVCKHDISPERTTSVLVGRKTSWEGTVRQGAEGHLPYYRQDLRLQNCRGSRGDRLLS